MIILVPGPGSAGPLNVSEFVIARKLNGEPRLFDPILSHLRPLFNAETDQSDLPSGQKIETSQFIGIDKPVISPALACHHPLHHPYSSSVSRLSEQDKSLREHGIRAISNTDVLLVLQDQKLGETDRAGEDQSSLPPCSEIDEYVLVETLSSRKYTVGWQMARAVAQFDMHYAAYVLERTLDLSWVESSYRRCNVWWDEKRIKINGSDLCDLLKETVHPQGGFVSHAAIV